MLEYAASRRQIAARPSSPHAMLAIVSVHVALLALVMSAKMDMPVRFPKLPPLIQVPVPPEPKPIPLQQSRPQPEEHQTFIDRTKDLVPPVSLQPPVTSDPNPNPAPVATGGSSSIPVIPQPQETAPIHHDALLLTPPWEL